MKYRLDKRTGNKLSILGFGCMRFPRIKGGIDMQKTDALIAKAVELGVNYFDTAYIYPGSEEALGAALKRAGLRDKVYLATKLPQFLTRNAADIDRYFEKSLERLKTDYIDYYLIHMLGDASSWERLRSFGIEEWIARKKAAGSIKSFGFSFHGTRENFLELLDVYGWDFCQIQYNYSDENYQAGVSGLKKAYAKDIPVIIMEPLLGGKLVNGLPSAALEEFKRADSSRGPAEWALDWLWNQNEPCCVLSGMNDMTMLEENCRAADKAEAGMLGEAGEATFERVQRIFNEAFKVRCTGCGYCMPCPAGVNIPSCFSAYNSYYAIGKRTGKQQYAMSMGAMSSKQHFASQCKKCGKCEKHCPQSIKIMDELESVKRLLEPFWLRPGSAIARAFLRLNNQKE